jgi:hypothetical protein
MVAEDPTGRWGDIWVDAALGRGCDHAAGVPAPADLARETPIFP